MRNGQTAHVTVREADDKIYFWSEDSQVFAWPTPKPMTTFHVAGELDQRIIVFENYGWDPKKFAADPYFTSARTKVFGGKSETLAIQLPADCAPHFAADNLLKVRMLKAIGKTVADELAGFNKCRGTHYSRTLKIVIANFDTDYPSTSIFIPSQNEIWDVGFYGRDLEDFLSEFGSFLLAGQIQASKAKESRAKILRYGIVRTITLGGSQ